MKLTRQNQIVNPSTELIVTADVSKDRLNCYASYSLGAIDYHLDDEFANRTWVIEAKLNHYAQLARTAGCSGVRILCEPTGGFEQKLLRSALRLGHQTALINPEHVAKLKTVESNDTGKTDEKDARVMHLVARLGKIQRHRQLPSAYQRLRRLTSFYDDQERIICALRTRMSRLILELFPDYDKSTVFTFDSTGTALMKAYGFNPYRIVRTGYKRFAAAIKKRVRFVRFATLEHLYACAETSVRYQMDVQVAELLERQLMMLFQDYEHHSQRCQQLRNQIEQIGLELQQQGELPLLDQQQGVTLFNLSRIAGETGPLLDFQHKRALLRYGGMNIRERKSGTYKGKSRISKKGRPLLRKVLAQAVFPLLRRDRLYGGYYHSKLKQGMPEQKAKTAVMRKFLEMIYALVKSGSSFDQDRFSLCESRYRMAA